MKTCISCTHYINGRPLLYPNTPDERQTWRQCKKGCTVNAKTMGCLKYSEQPEEDPFEGV